ncbi:hypothetical protein Tco_0331321, partial [Tanacetum coccineum]
VQRIENKAKTVYEVVSTRNDPEAHVAASHWWIQLAVTRYNHWRINNALGRNDENTPKPTLGYKLERSSFIEGC